MTALASTDVTVTVTNLDIIKLPNGCLSMPQIAFGNAALTYPANGVPLPAIGRLGDFRSAISRGLVFDDNPGAGYLYKYDKTNHTIRIWQGDYDAGADGAFVEVGAGHAPAATTLTLLLWGQ